MQGGLTIECPWRIVANEAVTLGASDHGHRFGLPEPVDVIAETLKKLHGAAVVSIAVDPVTADLEIVFSNELRLEAFNESSGFEGWNYADNLGAMIVAMGGGQLAVWERLSQNK